MSDIIEKPWGCEKLWALTDRYAGKIISIKKGCKLSWQYHQYKDEAIYVLEGPLVLVYGDDMKETTLGVGSSFHIPTGMKHRFWAKDHECTVVEVSSPELSDVVRISDEYNRV